MIDGIAGGVRLSMGGGPRPGFAGLLAWAVLSVMLACLACSAALADVDDLYQAKVLVTGQRPETRLPALERGMADVLVKLSGDPDIVRDPAAGLIGKAEAYVDSFRYRDLMEGIPVHDEQGTRDRPYELTIDFDPRKIDGVLRELKREPWTGTRPRLAVLLAVEFDEVTYLLAANGDRGRDQRESLAAAAWKYGLPIVLPTVQALAASGLTVGNLESADDDKVKSISKAAGGDAEIVGRLTWSREALGWIAEWRLGPDRWQIRGVNFDEAFRNAMSGALRSLSGHGAPH
jgi:hypothetical protein